MKDIREKDYFRRDKKVRFTFPVCGDCLNSADGKKEGNDLKIKAKVFADKDAEIYINGEKAEYRSGEYEAEITLKSDHTYLTAVDKKTGESDRISVYRLKDPEKKFRLSSDDNILFLRDLTRNADRYKSLFDNPYLKMYKRAHDGTGVCVHLNLFYETCDEKDSSDYFNLSMMTDKYREEWEANSGWLKLSFHSLKEEPIWPYRHTSYGEIYGECLKVMDEIRRFAGEKTMAKSTTVHFGSINSEGLLAMRSLGYAALAGYFEFDSEGNTLVAYNYPKDLVTYVGRRDFWHDDDFDITFSRIDRVLNLAKTVEENMDEVKKVTEIPSRSGFMELMIHEQYFYPDYPNYIEQFGEIVYRCCMYLKDKGYKGCFLDEII